MSPLDDASGVVTLRISDVGGVRSAVELARDADRHGAPAVVIAPVPEAGVDPFVATAAIATATDFTRLGVLVPLGGWHPYPIARRLAQLDKLSAGRLSWCPIHPDAQRCCEAIDLVRALLTSWAPDAAVNDRRTGVHVDLDRITRVRHRGRHYAVDSPLDVPPGPQGAVPVFAAPGAVTGRVADAAMARSLR